MPETTVLYIVSPAYSGSTLLTLLLATHPAVGTIGERAHFHRKMFADPIVGSTDCSCGRHFHACPLWSQARARLQAELPSAVLRRPFSAFRLFGGLPRPLERRVNGLVWRAILAGREDRLPWPIGARLREQQRANATLMRAVLDLTDRSVFLDSSKVAEHAVLLGRLPGWRVVVYHLLRDGRGQVASTVKHHPERAPAEAARRWAQQVRRETALLERSGLPVRRVRYEDLCADPRGVVAELLTFAGLDGSAATLDWQTADLHIMGNPMRLHSVAEIVDRQEWRTRLSAADLADFAAVAGELNRALGYID